MTEAKTAPKKKATSKKPALHPKYSEMISTAITTLKERNGSSRQAILKYIKANNKVGDNCDRHLKMALKRGVAAGALNQVKGTGASGSFKVGKVGKGEKSKSKKVAPKKSSTTAKKPATTKKPAKKPAAKKSTSSSGRKNTQKKKKPATKKASSAKKPKLASKKPVAKKPNAKKTKKPKK